MMSESISWQHFLHTLPYKDQLFQEHYDSKSRPKTFLDHCSTYGSFLITIYN